MCCCCCVIDDRIRGTFLTRTHTRTRTQADRCVLTIMESFFLVLSLSLTRISNALNGAYAREILVFKLPDFPPVHPPPLSALVRCRSH